MNMVDLGKRSVLGVGVNAIDYDGAVSRVMDAAALRRSMSVTALAVHGVMSGVADRRHRFRLNRFDLVCPDGQPVRWALNRIHGCGLSDRVYGPDLTLRLCRAAAAAGVSVFFFGGTDAMLDRLSQRLTERIPGLKVAGCRPSRFRRLTPDERDQLAAEIDRSGAGICFVGLGCPRQEIFAYEMRDRIRMPLVAVGAAFAFHAGMLRQAPPWMQRRGLEWLYRLIREPKRLWRRYATTNPAFAAMATLQAIGWYEGRDAETEPADELLFG